MNEGIKNIFLTGPMHSGKSTILNKVIERLPHLKIGGFRTVPLYENRQKIGFVLESLTGGKKCFAHMDMTARDQFDVYKFDYQVFEHHGVQALEAAQAKCDIILMDEIGMMEAQAKKFCQTISNCLEGRKLVLGAFQQRATWFWKMLQQRGDVRIFTINKHNPNNIADEILAFLHNFSVIGREITY